MGRTRGARRDSRSPRDLGNFCVSLLEFTKSWPNETRCAWAGERPLAMSTLRCAAPNAAMEGWLDPTGPEARLITHMEVDVQLESIVFELNGPPAAATGLPSSAPSQLNSTPGWPSKEAGRQSIHPSR